MLNSHAVKAIKNRRSIIFHDTMYAKDGKPQYEIRKEGSYYCIYPVNGSNKIGKGFLKEEDAEKKINELDLTEAKDSDSRGYKVTDQIIKGFMVYKSGKPNAFTAKNESGEQYEGTMEEIKAKIDAYWVKRDEDVMKQKVNDHGYVVNRMGDYHIIEGAGVDGGWWFAKEVRGKGKLETKKFKTRAQAEEHARMSQPNLDEDVMKQKDGLTSEDKRQIQESIRRLESKRKEAIKAGKENYLNSEIARLKKALEEPTDFFMRDISDSKTKDKSPRRDEDVMKQKTRDVIKIVNYKGYEISKNDNDNKFRVFLSDFEVFVPQKSLEAAKALIDKKNSKAKDSKTTKDRMPHPHFRIKDDKLFRLKSMVKKMKDSDSQREILAKLAEKAGDIEYANDVRSGKVPYGQLAKRIAYYGLYSTGDAKNYMGERSFRTYEAWKRACKQINPGVVFEGNKDICQAKPGIGEWDGNEGIIYNKDTYTKGSADKKSKDKYGDKIAYKGYLIGEYLNGKFWIEKDGFVIRHEAPSIEDAKKDINMLTADSKTKDDIFYQGQQYPAKELHRILVNKGKVKSFNALSDKEQKEREDNPFALYEAGDDIYAVVRRNRVN